MGEIKDDGIWDDGSAKSYQMKVAAALSVIAPILYRQDCHIKIKPPAQWHELVNDDGKLKLITRSTSGPEDYMIVRIPGERIKYTPWEDFYQNNVEGSKHSTDIQLKSFEGLEVEFKMPFLVYRALEVLTHLPPNTLRVCKANDCYNTFATFHKTKAYCSPRCRNRMGVYAARRKQKETLE
jgi:hypothetical protein